MRNKSPAIVRAATVEEFARHTVRWTSLGVLVVSFIGTIMAFNGKWPSTWRFWEQVSTIAIIAGVALQSFCTLMEWANRRRRLSIHYIGPLFIDVAGTYIGFASLLVPIFIRALERSMLPTIAATLVAHIGVIVLAFWFAYYPETNLVQE